MQQERPKRNELPIPHAHQYITTVQGLLERGATDQNGIQGPLRWADDGRLGLEMCGWSQWPMQVKSLAAGTLVPSAWFTT